MRGTRYIKEYYQYKLPRICGEQMTISYFAKEYFLYFHLWTWNIFPAIAWPMNIDKSLTLSGNSYWIMNTKDSIQIFIRRGFKQNEAFLNIYHRLKILYIENLSQLMADYDEPGPWKCNTKWRSSVLQSPVYW